MLAIDARPFTTAPRHGFAWAIGLYQRHLSPLKGFTCAHRALHRGCSCSQFAKKVLLTRGVRQAVMFTLARFQKCKQAYLTLSSRRQKKHSHWDWAEVPLEVLTNAPECAGAMGDCGACDVGALDCAGCAF